MAKKKLIKITAVKGRDEAMYASADIQYALVSSPENERRPATRNFTCKDYLQDAVQEFICRDKNGYAHRFGGEAPIDLNRMRLLISRTFENHAQIDDWKEKLFSAKQILNIYEEMAGFEKRSLITTVKYDCGNDRLKAWLVTGPGEWMRAPQALSLATLVFRMVVYSRKADVKTSEDVEAFWRGILEDYRGYGYDERRSEKPILKDHEKLRIGVDKFEPIMRNFDRIFTQNFVDAYRCKPKEGIHGSGGIYSLCSHKTGNRELEENFKKVLAEWSKKK